MGWQEGRAIELRRVLAWRVEERLRELGCTRASAAAGASCSRRTLHAVLRAEVGLGLQRLAGLARALDCAPADLLDANAHVRVEPTSSQRGIDLPGVVARNVQMLRRQRFPGPLVDLAMTAGVSKTLLYQFLARRCDTSTDVIAHVGATLGVSAQELATPGSFWVEKFQNPAHARP